jgi:hypothetical protein
MPRPPEYENLIKTKAFEPVQPTPGAVPGYLKNAGDYLAAAKGLDPAKSLQVFTMAYEGYYAIVQAVLEFHQVRTKDAGRNLAIQRVSRDLKLSTGEFAAVTRAHERRNNTSYVSPFPPVSKAEATAMVGILEKYCPALMCSPDSLPSDNKGALRQATRHTKQRAEEAKAAFWAVRAAVIQAAWADGTLTNAPDLRTAVETLCGDLH